MRHRVLIILECLNHMPGGITTALQPGGQHGNKVSTCSKHLGIVFGCPADGVEGGEDGVLQHRLDQGARNLVHQCSDRHVLALDIHVPASHTSAVQEPCNRLRLGS